MHVPEESLEKYRALMDLSRKADSEGDARSGRGEYGRAQRMWGIANMLRQDAEELRVPGKAEQKVSQGEGERKRTAYCGSCGETCKEYHASARGWGWNCLWCGYLTDEQVNDIADRPDPLYSDGTAVRWIERRKL